MSVEEIQSLADRLAARLGRAVLVDDHALRLVAASEDFGDADPARVWSLLHRRTRPEDVRHDVITRLAGPGHVPANPELGLWQRLCVPVRCRGMLLGFLWITDRFGDLTDAQIDDSARTATEVGTLLHARLVTAGREAVVRQELVERLVSEDVPTRRTAWDDVVDRGLLSDDGALAVLVARYRGVVDEDVPAGLLVELECLLRRGPGSRTLAAIWPRRVVVVVGGPVGERVLSDVRTLLAELADGWRVGLGGPTVGPDALYRAKRQADIALGTVEGSGVAGWSELSADAVVAQVAAQEWAGMVLPDGLAVLLTDPAAAPLLPSLETFLDCAGDVQRTAARLRVHRTTLYHRLGRVEQICGLSLRDGRDRLLIHLALRLRAMHGVVPDAPRATDDESQDRNVRRRAG